MGLNFDADNGDIIEAIQNSVEGKTIDVKDGQFVTREVFLAPKRELTPTLSVASLTGLIDYLNAKLDVATRQGLFVQVLTPVEVRLRGVVPDREDRRFTPIMAAADPPTIALNQYIGKEDAIIMLQSRFVQTGEQVDLLEKLGNLVADEELRQEDDGVTQTITTQAGIRRVDASIQNPVELRPFRTFTEIEQPQSPFIVRLKKDDRQGILVGLFEADGGKWRNDARRAIKNYLEENISDDVECPVIA